MRTDEAVRIADTDADELREAVMNMKTWCDRKFEHVLVMYMVAWAVALLVTYMLTE